jgi:type VI protein secretion system component Hcp
MKNLILASLIFVPASLHAQSTPNVSEIVVTKVTDSTSPLLFKNEPNAKLMLVRADGSPLAPIEVYITPTLLAQIRAGAPGTGKTLTAGLLGKGGPVKEVKLTCRKSGGENWLGLQNLAKGKEPFKSMTLVLKRRGGSKSEPYFEMKLEGASISRSSASAKSRGDRPAESLSINFTKIEYKNTP